VIRKASGRDAPFLRDMVKHAYYWRWADPATADVPASRYVEGWQRPGDRGVILIDESFPVGAAWFRLFKAGSPGYGFIDERTPELAIAVVPNARGKGVGSALIDSLLERARTEGFADISLSVDRHNSGAIALYEQHGFHQVDETDDSLTLRAELA